jgi:hypothetical protein
MTISRTTVIAAAQAALAKANALPADAGGSPPPPVPAAVDPVLVFDGSSGLTRDGPYGGGIVWAGPTSGNVGAWLTWKNPGGDWLDKDGIAQGPTPFASLDLKVGATGPVALDVTALVVPGVVPQLVLRGTGSPGVSFKSRESGGGAVLKVTYADGTADTVPVACDVNTDPSTQNSVGAATTIGVAALYTAYLRFPAVTKPVASAQLVLDIVRVWSAVTVRVFRFAVHLDAPDPYIVPIDKPFFQTEAFERGTIPAYLADSLFDHDQYKQRNVVNELDANGAVIGKTLECRWSRLYPGCVASYIVFPGADGVLGAEVEEVGLEFDIKFLPDYIASLAEVGGKLLGGFMGPTRADAVAYETKYGIRPGSCGTPLVDGGLAANGHNGWSLRNGWGSPYAAPHPLAGLIRLQQYAYWALGQGYNSPVGNGYGTNWPWSQFGTGACAIDRYYRIRQYLKMNTPGIPDGVLKVWIDNRLAFSKSDVFLRQPPPYDLNSMGVQTQLGCRSIILNQYHGGASHKPLANGGVRTRNWSVQVYR